VPHCPVLYMYGADKPSRFHGDGWLAGVRANGVGSLVVRVENAGHWFPVTHADVVNERLTRWLDLIGDLPRTNIRSAL
jgi:pimeloyl-ACP methyl ester carboxylesterase